MIMTMPKTRALGIIRLSKTADPASTSIDRQREIIEHYIEQQDRLVRRTADFIGIVNWCRDNDKKLYSATEGLGDVTQHAGLLVGFITAWQSEGESLSTSARVKDTQAKLAKEGRWRGGRLLYGFRPICICHQLAKCPEWKDCKGWKLIPDENGSAVVVREAARRVIAGESANAVVADFNRRGVKSADGYLWKALTLRRILRKPALMDGIVSVTEWNQLQDALNARRRNQYVRTLDRDTITLDLVFCGLCGGKIYRWTDKGKQSSRVYGRCRNELKRAEAAQP